MLSIFIYESSDNFFKTSKIYNIKVRKITIVKIKLKKSMMSTLFKLLYGCKTDISPHYLRLFLSNFLIVFNSL